MDELRKSTILSSEVPWSSDRVPEVAFAQPSPCNANTTVPADPQWILEYLEKILAHSDWQGTPRRDKFLRYIVTETLAGRSKRLKGTVIAIDVFGRIVGSDSAGEAIVRVEARRLRRDLDSYYAGPGRWDPIRICVPKGAYIVAFEVQQPAPSNSPNVSAAVGQHGSAPAEPFVGHGTQKPAAAPLPVVLVRPFTALGGRGWLRHLAVGLTQEVISGLMRFPGLRLHSAEDSFAAPGAAVRSKDDALDSPPTYAVRGVVQADADLLKVIVRLVAIPDGRVIWSRAFTRPLTTQNVILVQSEIAGDISDALAAPEPMLRDGLIVRIARLGAPSIESYMAVLAAQSYRRTNLSESYADTLAGLERAVRCDPGYADAWAHLAFLLLDGQRFGHETVAKRGGFVEAMTAARRALALDPENIPGHLALLMVQHYAAQDCEALATGARALEISPHDADVLASLGWLKVVGHNDPTGIALLDRAVARTVNPPPRYFRSITVHHLMWGTPDDALEAANHAVLDGLGVSAGLLAIACAQAGRWAESAEAVEIMAQRCPALARNPKAYLTPHRPHPAIVATFVSGLHRAGLPADPART